MSSEDDKIKELEQIQSTFRSKFRVLKKTKDAFLKLFRQKLEENKIKEIKQNISNINS